MLQSTSHTRRGALQVSALGGNLFRKQGGMRLRFCILAVPRQFSTSKNTDGCTLRCSADNCGFSAKDSGCAGSCRIRSVVAGNNQNVYPRERGSQLPCLFLCCVKHNQRQTSLLRRSFRLHGCQDGSRGNQHTRGKFRNLALSDQTDNRHIRGRYRKNPIGFPDIRTLHLHRQQGPRGGLPRTPASVFL